MKALFLYIFISVSLVFVAQNNALVINNDAFIVINGGTIGDEAVLVVNQSHPNGITTSGTGGNIITNGEFDYIKWNNGTGTGNYNVPFTARTGMNKIPLQINISSAGVGNGYMALSSWEVSPGPASNNQPWPSEVVHMAGANGQADVSEYAIDRFWVIDVRDPLGTGQTFTTFPTPTIIFNYSLHPDEIGGGNVLATNNLGAQQYDGTQNKWFGWFTAGIPNGIYGNGAVPGIVSGVNPPAGTWYRTWTLADMSEPLPVEMTYFNGNCEDNGIVIEWQTASELNNDYFEIHKSQNGYEFEKIATIIGNGNSSYIQNYSYTDEVGASSNVFYKIAQVDFDGNTKFYDPIQVNPCMGDNGLNVYAPNLREITIELTSSFDADYEMIIYDALGKQIKSPSLLQAKQGFNRFDIQDENLAFGTYMITLFNDQNKMTKKLILR